MAGTIEKYITTKSDFEAGIIKFIMTPYWTDGAITMKMDKTDNKTVNTILHPTATGASSIVENNASFPKKIVLKNIGEVGDRAYIESDILPEQYEIKYYCDPNSVIFASTYCMGGIGKFNYIFKLIFRIDATNKREIIYRNTARTAYYWNGAAWQLGATNFGAATGATQYIVIKKDATNFTVEIYTAGVLITTAVIAIASVYNGSGQQEHFIVGDISNVITSNYALILWDISGLYIDRYSEKPGAFSAIIDLGTRPVISGSYVEVINNNWYDEELPQEKTNALTSLRDAAARTYLSQGFKLTKNGIVEKCRFNLKEVGAIIAGKKVWVEIWTDDGSGLPNALISGYTSALVEATTIQSGYTETTYTEFIFAGTTNLSKNVQYHLILKADYAIDGTNYISVYEEYVGSYTKGVESEFGGATWTSKAGYDLIFGVKLKATQLITRKIGYANSPDYKTLSSKADFEGYSEVQSQIDTATTPGTVIIAIDGGTGKYYASGYIQNDIDLGVVPAYYCTFSADYYVKPVDTTLVFKIATSDDGVAWTAFSTLTMTQGYCDLTSFGKHRYWRVKIEFATTDTDYTPEIYAWTIDYFSPATEFETSDKILPYRYIKLLYLFETYNPLTSIELTEIYLSFLIAYELYIKRVKYKISAAGITADMELSSQ